MAGHTFFGKRRLCYTDVVGYTDFQGIGHDPMYKRYDSVFSVIKTAVSPEYHHFLATPQYVDDEDQICWHIDEWNESPVKLTSLSGAERLKYDAIKDDTIRHFRGSAAKLDGEELQILGCAIKYVDDDRIYCADDKVFLIAWGMTPDTKAHKVIGSVIHEYDIERKCRITFDPGTHGTLQTRLEKSIIRVEGTTLSSDDVPIIKAADGWNFLGWDPFPVGHEVNGNVTFMAKYEKVGEPDAPPISVIEPPFPPEDDFFSCRFIAGDHGTIDGASDVRKAANTKLQVDEIPGVRPHKGYKFTGWNISPFNCLVNEDKVFIAQYEHPLPWYRRWWIWLKGLFVGKGCLKWILGILLFLLLLWLLSLLLHRCKDERREEENGVVPIHTVTRPDGKVVDDNGFTRPVTGSDGRLPDSDMIVAPVMGEGGEEPPIIEQPGTPSIIANRLFLFLEDESDSVEELARDFKLAYPEDEYCIIGYDKEVKMLVVQIPEEERDNIRKTINSKIPNHKFLVFDEEIYELRGSNSNPTSRMGWHLDAIHLRRGWEYTKGSSEIKVAVVDDGIQASHPMFKGRIVDAYNVFTQNNALSLGDGHGTHTAGLAAGSDEFYSKGASGVAPGCKLMPIQVFDNGQCPLSALVAGVMYAIHHDADVVNISIGPSFKGLDVLPVDQQDEIAQTQFHNVAVLWDRVCKLASRKNTILVFAAGNDDILASIPPENRNASSIVVVAVDNRLYPTDFTNYGPCSDISAPGKDIYSSFPTNKFQSCDGTSMAAPIVTGTIALMKSINKRLTVEQVRNILYSTGADVYGYIPPMVLVDKALLATKNEDFKRVERELRPVPDGDDSDSGQIPDKPNGRNSGSPGKPDTPVGRNIGNPQTPAPGHGDETDYDAIRRKIAEYKKKIEDLERLLPNKR